MSMVLNYALARRESESRFQVPAVLYPVLVSFAHLNFCWQVTKLMIVPVCWAEHLNFSVWTPMAWLPGTLVSSHNGPLGVLLMVAASVLAGFLTWGVVKAFMNRVPMTMGLALRIFVAVMLWISWMPLPATWSLPYQFSVWASKIL